MFKIQFILQLTFQDIKKCKFWWYGCQIMFNVLSSLQYFDHKRLERYYQNGIGKQINAINHMQSNDIFAQGFAKVSLQCKNQMDHGSHSILSGILSTGQQIDVLQLRWFEFGHVCIHRLSVQLQCSVD